MPMIKSALIFLPSVSYRSFTRVHTLDRCYLCYNTGVAVIAVAVVVAI